MGLGSEGLPGLLTEAKGSPWCGGGRGDGDEAGIVGLDPSAHRRAKSVCMGGMMVRFHQDAR